MFGHSKLVGRSSHSRLLRLFQQDSVSCPGKHPGQNTWEGVGAGVYLTNAARHGHSFEIDQFQLTSTRVDALIGFLDLL